MEELSTAAEFQVLEIVQACASNPVLWKKALEKVQETFGCQADLLSLDSAGHHTGRFCEGGQATLYIEYLLSLRPKREQNALDYMINEAEPFRPYSPEQLDRFETRSTFNSSDASQAFDGNPAIISRIRKNADEIVLLCCRFSTADRERWASGALDPSIERLSKAMSVSLDLADRIDRTAQWQSALHMMLQQQTRAMFLIDRDHSVRVSTPPCEKLLSDGDFFSLENERLVPLRKEIETALADVSAHISDPGGFREKAHVKSAPLNGDKHSVVLSRTDDRLARVVFQPLVPKSEHKPPHSNAYILIEVRDSLEISNEVNNLLKSCYDLSEKESQLAFSLANTGSMTSTLEILGITRNTAKTHLRRIYEKTATQSQLELSKLLHGLANLI